MCWRVSVAVLCRNMFNSNSIQCRGGCSFVFFSAAIGDGDDNDNKNDDDGKK